MVHRWPEVMHEPSLRQFLFQQPLKTSIFDESIDRILHGDAKYCIEHDELFRSLKGCGAA